MTSAGSQALNPISAAQHMFGIGVGKAASAMDPSRYLGPESGTLATNPYDRVAHTNYQYPEAVKDSTLFVKSTVEGFVMEDIEWMTTLALPWAQTDQMTVTWNEWKFNQGLTDRVPHEGVSRLVTSSKRTFKTHVVRRGLAFIQEADYANTPEGMEQYARNVAQISQAVQETSNHDTVYAILNCKTYDRKWMQDFGTSQVSIRTITEAAKRLYGSVCEPTGDDILAVRVEDIKRMMRKQGVIPNMLFGWPGIAIYMSMVPPARTEYMTAGPDGVARRERGPDSITVFHGLAVFEARDFDVYGADAPPVQLLTRPSQIAEHYPMRFDRIDEPAFDYSTKERGIVIYDENMDQWKKISFLRAFNHANIFDSNGNYRSELGALVRKYRDRHQRPKTEKIHDDDDDDIDLNDVNNIPTMALTAFDAGGEAMLLKYFGQMQYQHMSSTAVERIAETISAKLGGHANRQAYRDMVRLINDIESQNYTAAYGAALAAANLGPSSDSTGKFVGEMTPPDLLEHWGGTSAQRQWTSNAYGGLDLPMTAEMHNISYPVGFANGPGLETLAAEADNPESPWYEAGKRARSAVMLMQDVADTVRTHLMTSASVDEASRSPWFHKASSTTAAYEMLFGTSRDPLFMLAPTPTGGPMTGGGSSGGGGTGVDRGQDLDWFSVAGTVQDIGFASVVRGNADAVAEAVRTGSAARAGADVVTVNVGQVTGTANVTYLSPTTGQVVTTTLSNFNSVIRFTPDMSAFGVLPGGNDPKAIQTRKSYFAAMASMADRSKRSTFAAFVNKMGMTRFRTKMWRAVYGMTGMDEEDVVAAVDDLYLSEKATDVEMARSSSKIEELSAIAPAEGEWSDLKPLREAWDAVAARTSSGVSSPAVAGFDTAEDVQRIMDLQRDIGSPKAFAGDNAFNAASIPRGTPAKVASELRDLMSRVNADAEAMGFSGIGAPAVTFSDDVGGADYYRVPLTSSLRFLQSLAQVQRAAGAGVAVAGKPMLLPGNPNTGNTKPYDSGGSFPASVLGGTSYDTISSAMGHAATATNYASISELQRGSAHASLDETSFMRRFRAADFTPDTEMATMQDGASASFDDDIEKEDAEVANLFGGAPTEYKKSRSDGSASIGAHMETPAHLQDVTSHPTLHRGVANSIYSGDFDKHWKDAADISDPFTRMCARAFLLTNCEHKATWVRMIEDDILIPIDLVLGRLFITHDMASVVVMKGGLETGANLYGGANIARSKDGVSKILYHNFTFRSKSVVWKERNIAILEDVKYEGYRGGCNTEIATRSSDLDNETIERPSIIVVPIGISERELPHRFDFTGRDHVPQGNVTIDGPNRWHYSSAEYVDSIFHLSSKVHVGNAYHDDFFDRSDQIGFASFQGHQFSYNKTSRRYNRFIMPTSYMSLGHQQPGAAAVLGGQAKAFPDFSPEHVFIE